MLTPVVIVHYHLRPGGVTKVIESQVKALQAQNTPYVILSGEAYDGDSGLRQAVIPELDYNSDTSNVANDAQELYDLCLNEVAQRFGNQEVIWLIHNPVLGKNVLYPQFIAKLADAQQRILLLCHDFSEDGRPQNFTLTADETNIYPVAPNIHYAFINSRDKELLQKAGLPHERLHYLPNSLTTPTISHQHKYGQKNLVLYPVRGIRRKNIGEFLLWSLLAPEDTHFALTLKPKNEQWIPIYKVWVELTKDLNLPVTMGCVGLENAPGRDGSSFIDWLEASTHCISTSVAEGFGLTFLEPLAMNTPLIGRDLPEITKDFTQAVETGGDLYEKLLVPVSAIDEGALKRNLRSGLESNYYAYQTYLPESEVQKTWKLMSEGGYIDFGNLPEQFQIEIIIKAKFQNFRDFKVQLGNGDILNAAEWIAEALAPKFSSEFKPEFLDQFSQKHYDQRFTELIEIVNNSETGAPMWLNKLRVLGEFLAPERFHFLRT